VAVFALDATSGARHGPQAETESGQVPGVAWEDRHVGVMDDQVQHPVREHHRRQHHAVAPPPSPSSHEPVPRCEDQRTEQRVRVIGVDHPLPVSDVRPGAGHGHDAFDAQGEERDEDDVHPLAGEHQRPERDLRLA
jgi:hypothetical protein